MTIEKPSEVAFTRHLITLRMTRPAGFHFLHGGAINGLLCNALQSHPLPEGVAPFACESGRVRCEAGERYNIGLTLVGETRGLLDPLIAGLERIGASEPDRSRSLPALCGNFEIAQVAALPAPSLDDEAAALAAGGGTMTLQFLSPLRMERPRAQKLPGEGYLNASFFPVPHFLSRVWGRAFRLAEGHPPSEADRDALRPALPTGALARHPRLLWVDLPVPANGGVDGEPRAGLRLGGVMGSIELTGIPAQWFPLLVVSQYLHAGEHVHFGLGRYRIVESAPADDPFRPARTLLDRLTDPALLREALHHVVRHSKAAGEDGELPERVRDRAEPLVERLVQDLASGAYRPGRLRGRLLPKEGGKVRPLAIPTVRDRAAQRAACQLLAPAIDTLLEDTSFAYRKGLSRAGAAAAIQRAHDEGFRYVLDADISSFFDAVDWNRLFIKLEALFPREPLVPLFEAWVTAPVVFGDRVIRRAHGLPQGAGVSPLLANLFLDEFDEELLGHDYRLVRYADDFVVLCRDLDQARQAQEDARRALADLGLELAVEKTAIRSFDEGFSYLGYLFCRSVVLDQHRDKATEIGPLDADKVPKASWLAAVPMEDVRRVLDDARHVRRVAPPAGRPLPLWDAATPLRRPVYVTDPAATLALRAEKLIVGSPSTGNQEAAIRTISHVVFLGHVRATVAVILALGRLGVPCYFCRRTGALYNVFSPHAPDWPLWQAQAARAADAGACLDFARAVVQAKLHNTATRAVSLKLQGAGKLAEDLRELERSCLDQTSVEAVRGFEGRGARIYFEALRDSISPEWGFTGRRKHPAPDPVNAMLSFGYTILYNHLSTAILAAGLHPRIGLFHEERGAYHALACDLQEEFRHLVDAHVLAMIRRREITPEDFVAPSDGGEGCLLTVDARRSFIRAFEKRLVTEFTPPGEEKACTYLAYMDRQVQALKAYILGQTAAYEPLRLHA